MFRDLLPALMGMLMLQNSCILPAFPEWAEEQKPDCGIAVEPDGVWVCTHKGAAWVFLQLLFALLTEVWPLLPSCLVLADTGSMYSL